MLVSHEMVTYVGDFLDASLRWNDGRDWVDLGLGGWDDKRCGNPGGKPMRRWVAASPASLLRPYPA